MSLELALGALEPWQPWEAGGSALGELQALIRRRLSGWGVDESRELYGGRCPGKGGCGVATTWRRGGLWRAWCREGFFAGGRGDGAAEAVFECHCLCSRGSGKRIDRLIASKVLDKVKGEVCLFVYIANWWIEALKWPARYSLGVLLNVLLDGVHVEGELSSNICIRKRRYGVKLWSPQEQTWARDSGAWLRRLKE